MALPANPLVMLEDGSYSHMAAPDREWEEFYSANPEIVPTLTGSPIALRKVMDQLKHRATSLMPSIDQGLSVKNVPLTTTDGSTIDLRIYTPTAHTGPYPTLLYMHGGGWTLGSLDADDTTCRSICVRTSVMVLSVGYRLAPEHPYPAGLEDAWASLNWTLQHAKALKVDKNSIIIAGSSAGANLAAVITHRARAGGIKIKGQLLRMPTLCHPDHYPPEFEMSSMKQNGDAPILSKQSMDEFYRFYNPPNLADIDVSPLLADDFEILPPTHFQICGGDPLRDEGLAYAQKLKEAGVACTIDIYPGLPHAFTFYPELSAARKYAADTLKAVERLLGQ